MSSSATSAVAGSRARPAVKLPGVHTLWLPVIALGVGLVMKPGGQEPWTPYRMAAAMIEAGIPSEAIGLYPGATDVGASILASCKRSMIFGSAKTVEQYRGNPGVQVHGPGFSKILIGDDVVDRWEDHIDMMVESVAVNGGRGCINCSAIWASRHTEAIAAALAERLGPVDVLPPDDPNAKLAAFTIPGRRQGDLGADRRGLRARGEPSHRDIRPAASGGGAVRLAAARRCPLQQPGAGDLEGRVHVPVRGGGEVPPGADAREDWPDARRHRADRGSRLQAALIDCTEIDRLNFGPVPTTKLDWLQPHEGNIIDFLYRSRALQVPAGAGVV